MDFDSHKIENPYEFIDDLYYRLKMAKQDIDNSLKSEEYYSENHNLILREKVVLSSIINWFENYKENSNEN